MRNFKSIVLVVLMIISCRVWAQDKKLSWKKITEIKDSSWYASAEAKKIAENVLLYQRDIGGWPKNIEMQEEVKDQKDLIKKKSDPSGCTIDNGATCQEMRFLSNVYRANPDERYKSAFLKGVMYLVSAQYQNGGWPQYFPLKEGYYSHITYNDNAMVNVMNLMNDIQNKTGVYAVPVPEEIRLAAANAFNKGVACILKTQYKQDGKLTAWCSQHDRETLAPAQARAYELPSLSGKESAKITLLLMTIKNPTPEVVNAVEAAVCWFEKTKITGIKVATVATAKGDDRVVVSDPEGEPLWARFMELKDNTPFFCDRDGEKKYSLSEIGYERRNGYAWYSNEPKEVLKKFDKWKKSLQ